MESLDDIYRSESLETLDDIEAALLALEECQTDSELIRRVFRGMHTIKGSGAMFGFTKISQFAHQIEMLFEQIRNGKLPVTPELMDLTLLSCDLIRAMLADASQADPALSAQAYTLVEKIKATLANPTPAEVAEPLPLPLFPQTLQLYRLRIRLLIDRGERSGLPMLTREKLAQLGEYFFVTPEESAELGSDYQSCDIVLRSPEELEAVRAGVLATGTGERPGRAKMMGEVFLVREAEGEAAGFAPSWWESQLPLGTILLEDAIADQWLVASALTDRPGIRGLQRECQAVPPPALFLVDKVNLDKMVALVGNLASLHERVTDRLHGLADPQLLALDQEMEQVVDDLRRTTMRMLWHLR